MKAIVAHSTTEEKALGLVDRSAANLFDFESDSIVLTDQKKHWSGSVMRFSLIAKAGFIALPLNGTVTVDHTYVTIHCDLPPLVRTFVGEDKIRAGIEKRLASLLVD